MTKEWSPIRLTVEAVFAPFEDRLPTQARDIAKQAHVQAKDARTQLRNMRPTAVA